MSDGGLKFLGSLLMAMLSDLRFDLLMTTLAVASMFMGHAASRRSASFRLVLLQAGTLMFSLAAAGFAGHAGPGVVFASGMCVQAGISSAFRRDRVPSVPSNRPLGSAIPN